MLRRETANSDNNDSSYPLIARILGRFQKPLLTYYITRRLESASFKKLNESMDFTRFLDGKI